MEKKVNVKIIEDYGVVGEDQKGNVKQNGSAKHRSTK